MQVFYEPFYLFMINYLLEIRKKAGNSIMNKSTLKLVPVIAIPFVLGTIGYLPVMGTVNDALYASFLLYFSNPITDEFNIWIDIARWTAPLATVTTFFYIMKNLWSGLEWWLAGFSKKNVAVYTDTDVKIRFTDDDPAGRIKAVYPGEKFLKQFGEQIILISDDEKNLRFYEMHKAALADKHVYMGIHDLESGLVKGVDQVTLFDVNRSIARLLWKEIALWNQKGHEIRFTVAIRGNGGLARQILSTGLQLNILSLDQQITYHFITDDPTFERRHHELNLMNADRILYHTSDSKDAWDAIRESDLLILADRPDHDLLQDALVNTTGPVYYYSPDTGDIGNNLDSTRLHPFGRNADVLTDENIRMGKLIAHARQMNQTYKENHPEYGVDWDELTGFYKESNISAADYQDVLAALSEEQDLEHSEALQNYYGELEHIRWSRFYYLNYWKYNPVRNNARREHPDLLPYRELSKEEQQKDIDFVMESRK